MSFTSAEPKGQSQVAIASLSLGVAGLLTFFCFLGLPLSLGAIITGVIGRYDARRRGVSETPATVGLIIGPPTAPLDFVFPRSGCAPPPPRPGTTTTTSTRPTAPATSTSAQSARACATYPPASSSSPRCSPPS